MSLRSSRSRKAAEGLKPRSLLGFFCLFFALSGLALSAPQKIETKDGVRIVHNVLPGGSGTGPSIGIKLVRNIGDVDSEDENLAFSGPRDIAENGAGEIFIADSAACRVLHFDRAGRFLSSFGRKGQGPGEFGSIGALVFDGAGRLLAHDDSQRRLQVLTEDGRADAVLLFRKSRLSRLRPQGKDRFVIIEYHPGMQPIAPKSLLKIIDPKEDVLAEFCEPREYGEAVTNDVANSISFAVGPDETVAASFAFQNRIEKYSREGKLVWRADRPLDFGTKILEKGKSEASGQSVTFTAPKMNACSRDIAVDGAGRIWVATYRRQIKPEEQVRVSMFGSSAGVVVKREGNTDLRTTDMFRLDVFDPDGVLLETIPLTHFVDGIWIFGSRLYLLDRDRGVTYYQYDIEEE